MDDLTRLALSARDGDGPALSTLIHRTQSDVWRVCRNLGPPGMADDLAQDVFLRVLNGLHRFNGESSFRTWLLAVARNTATDATRTRRRRERVQALLHRDIDVSLPVERDEVTDLLDLLDADQRAAFVMTQIIGLTYEETAAVCACAIGTIRSRVARARTRLIESMAAEVALDRRDA